MDYSGYQLARVEVVDGVASVVINNPPINIFDLPLYGEMAKLAGELAVDNDVRALHVRGDSLLLVQQMKGVYRVKNEGLLPLYREARHLCARIGTVTFEHVPRERNKDADRLSNVGMDSNEV